MGLDILDATIIKNLNSIGGFCIIENSKIDYKNYFPVDQEKIGVHIYNPPWSNLGPSPTQRRDHSAVDYNDKMYIYGGLDAGYNRLNDLWSYEYSINTWTALSNGPVTGGIQGHKAIVYNDKMYVYGGRSSSIVDAMYEYDFSGNSWSFVNGSDSIIGGRYNHSMVQYNGYIFVIFGMDVGAGLTNTLWRFNIESHISGNSEVWEDAGPVSAPWFSSHSMDVVVYNGIIHMFGGIGLQNRRTYLDISSQAQPSAPVVPGGWNMTTMPVSAGYNLTSSVDETTSDVYIFGGTSDTNDLWSYNIDSDTYTQKESGSIKRRYHTSVINSGSMYVYGGADDGGYGDSNLWRYSFDSTNSLTTAVKIAKI